MTSKALDNVVKLNGLAVSVKEFGAKGDGVTDDTPAFQAAIDSSAKEIVIPSGTYALASYVNVASKTDLTIRGVGSPVLFQPAGKDDANAFLVSFFRFTQCTNINISGLKVNGNRTAYAALNTYFANADNFRVFWIIGCANVVVQNCIIENWQGPAIKIVAFGAAGGSSVAQIRADAAKPGCNGLKVIGNTFNYCGYAVQVNPSSSYNIYVQNNTIFNTDYAAITIYPHGYGVFVQDNTMQEIGRVTTGPLPNDGYAVRYYECAGGIISGNQISKCDYGIVLLYSAVDFVNRDISIVNNVIIDDSQYGTTGGSICVTGDNLQIDGNTIGETSTTAKYIAVELEGHNISFLNNVVEYSPSAAAGYTFRIGYDALHGAATYSCDNINVTNNRVAVTSGVYGILLNPSATIDGVYIGQNKITGQSGAEIYDPNSKVIYELTASSGSAAPTTNTWKRGDVVWNNAAGQFAPAGFICVTAGTPGAWLPFGAPASATDTAANIAAVGNARNTTGKFAGLLVWDTTNTRLMRASGPLAADPWVVVDGSASVTPS
jgi:hypothetical protein